MILMVLARGVEGGGPVSIDIELTMDEFADLFQETLELPRIEPKGDRSIKEVTEKYNTIHRVGPYSQIHLERTYEEAKKEWIARGRQGSVFLIPITSASVLSSWLRSRRTTLSCFCPRHLGLDGAGGD